VQAGCTEGTLSVALAATQASDLTFAVRGALDIGGVSSAYATGVSCVVSQGTNSCTSGLTTMVNPIPANGLVDLEVTGSSTDAKTKIILTFTCD
jgi:hypothetical protein